MKSPFDILITHHEIQSGQHFILIRETIFEKDLVSALYRASRMIPDEFSGRIEEVTVYILNWKENESKSYNFSELLKCRE